MFCVKVFLFTRKWYLLASDSLILDSAAVWKVSEVHVITEQTARVIIACIQWNINNYCWHGSTSWWCYEHNSKKWVIAFIMDINDYSKCLPFINEVLVWYMGMSLVQIGLPHWNIEKVDEDSQSIYYCMIDFLWLFSTI